MPGPTCATLEPVSTEQISERQRAGEERNEQRKQRAIRRTPAIVIGLAALVTLLASVAYAVDQRRLSTPAGVTQAWVQAALAADCGRYAELSAAPDGKRGLTPAQCDLVLAASPPGPGRNGVVRVSGVVLLRDARATADVSISVSGFPQRASRVELSNASGEWIVLRTPSTCALLTCP